MVVVDAMRTQYLDHTSVMHSTVYSKNIIYIHIFISTLETFNSYGQWYMP